MSTAICFNTKFNKLKVLKRFEYSRMDYQSLFLRLMTFKLQRGIFLLFNNLLNVVIFYQNNCDNITNVTNEMIKIVKNLSEFLLIPK